MSVSTPYPAFVAVSFLLGLFSGYTAFGNETPVARIPAPQPTVFSPTATVTVEEPSDVAALMRQVNPADGYALPVAYDDLGPRLLASGVIDFEAFSAIYEKAGNPLSAAKVGILTRGSSEQIVITPENAHFLLNFFWAVGLVNKNPILTEGPMVQNSGGQVERFASTGGWGLATKPITELYASIELIPLTPAEQARVEEVAGAVYRPCCNNPTLFPDCNHGMAMLGLLELMASEGATVEEMFEAAKYVNAFWFPRQALEVATYLSVERGIAFADADARLVTGREFFSGAGFGAAHKRLQELGLLPPAAGGQGSCAN
jgi:hypothetical protein